LPRHLFHESIDDWAEGRGVLVKAIEDIALGTASVYRQLELALPDKLSYAGEKTLAAFADLVAKIMPFDLVIDEETADGRGARAVSTRRRASRAGAGGLRVARGARGGGGGAGGVGRGGWGRRRGGGRRGGGPGRRPGPRAVPLEHHGRCPASRVAT